MRVWAVHTVVFGQVYSGDGGNDDLTFTVVLPDDGGVDAVDYTPSFVIMLGFRVFKVFFLFSYLCR